MNETERAVLNVCDGLPKDFWLTEKQYKLQIPEGECFKEIIFIYCILLNK